MAKPTKSELWDRIKKKYRNSTEGGKRGTWTPDKLTRARFEYKREGGEWRKIKAPAPN